MSQPKRYSLVASYYSSDAKMEAFEDGEFIRHADYAELKAENATLQAKVDWLRRADRLVCWDGKEWQPRLEVKEEPEPQ